MYVRQAQIEDLPLLASFDEWKCVSDQRIRDGECFVAGFDTPPVAFALLNRSFFERPFVAIIFVHPDHRHEGLGRALLRHLASRTTEPKLWISTNIENLPMQRLLASEQYTLAGTVHDLGKIPELIYYKRLHE